jgi:hypothetical protein
MTLLAALVALVPLAAPGPAPAAVAARPAGARPAQVEVFATGLVYPRGLDFGPGGRLYVAEAGPGGDIVTPGTCPGYTSPFEPYHSALTARISRIDRAGRRTTVAGGLPSARDRFGDVLGAADVEVRGRTVYALVAGGGCSRGLESTPSGVWRLDRDRGRTVVADFSRFLAANPTAAPPDDDFEPDGAVYGMAASGGSWTSRPPARTSPRRPWPAAAATCTSATSARSPSSGAPRSSSGSPSTAATSGSWPPA